MRRAVLGVVGLLVVAGVVSVPRVIGADDDAPARFRARPLAVESLGWLFDIGVADVDGDGRPDVYTSSHNARQTLLLNRGGWVFDDAVVELGLAQDDAFPEWDRVDGEPAVVRRGVNIWRRGNDIVVRLAAASSDPPVTGELDAPSAIEVVEQRRATVDVEVTGRRAVATFRLSPGGEVRLRPRLIGAPLVFRIDAPAGGVFVGPTSASPPAAHFTVGLRDRHGMAWADVDGDGDEDLYVTRGGLKGDIGRHRGVVADELFVRGPLRFDRTPSAIEGATCRGRRAEWVDADVDGDLDLSVGCLGAPHRLHLRGGDGVLAAPSDRLEADRLSPHVHRWVDLEGDGTPELVGVADDRLVVISRRDDRWRRTDGVRLGTGRPRGLTPADLDGDGDLDLLVSALDGHRIVEQREGELVVADASDRGLPAEGAAAEPADVDGDGRVDVVAWPGGLHLQRADGRFERVDALAPDLPDDVEHARVSTLDADGDGDLDVLLAVARREDRDWAVRLLDNPGRSNSLVLRLEGPPAGRDGIGARVRVTAGGRTITAVAGQSDGAAFSSGNRLVHVGLGPASRADSVEVLWTGGGRTALGPMPAGSHTVAHR